MVGPIDVKRKEGALVRYWVNYVTLTFDLTHDLDLVVWRSKFEIALFEEWGVGGGGLLDIDRKGCESIIHDHDCDLWVTMLGWVVVPYSDWGDFRRWRAVDISSWVSIMKKKVNAKLRKSSHFKFSTSDTTTLWPILYVVHHVHH